MRLAPSVAASAAVVVAALSGCGGGKPAGCVTVDKPVAQAIANGANGSGLTLFSSTGRAIKSASSDVYYVAFKVNAAGSEETAVWAVDSVTAPAGIRSVDGFASQFTDWPRLEGANGSDAMDDALACLD